MNDSFKVIEKRVSLFHENLNRYKILIKSGNNDQRIWQELELERELLQRVIDDEVSLRRLDSNKSTNLQKLTHLNRESVLMINSIKDNFEQALITFEEVENLGLSA